jgi:exodeoxyribonuclease X
LKLAEATFVIFDVETTSLKPEDENRGIVEVAAVAVTLANPLLAMWASLVNPEQAIPPEVSAVHGLTDRDVASAQPWSEVLPRLHAFVAPFSPIVKASHNFAFDSTFLRTRHGVCTERLARHLFLDDAPNFKNATLRYWRGLEVDTFAVSPHRALGDSLVTGALLRDLLASPQFAALGIDDTEALIAYCESPIIHTYWNFGKYGPLKNGGRKIPIDASDLSYIDWCLREMQDLSPDMRATLERVVAQPILFQKGAAA